MKPFRFIFFTALAVILTSGIYRHDRPVERYMQLANDSRFNCTGYLLKSDDGAWKSGGSFVVIDSLHILSAAHCFMGEERKDTLVDYQGMKVKTYIVTGHYQRPAADFRFFVQNNLLGAKSIVLHPEYIENGSCDIAMITLDKPLPNQPILALNEVQDELGDTVTGVGFGVSGPANKPELVLSYGCKLAGQNILDSIGGVKSQGIETMLFADFDHPDGKKKNNRLGSNIPLDLEYTIGGGDSGGPLFRFKNGQLELVGLAAYGDNKMQALTAGYYGCIMGWTRVAAFKEWIAANRK